MSTQLKSAGIDILEGYGAEHLDLDPDLVVVGNAMTRGKPIVERLLNERRRYVSGPQWLAEQVLAKRTVLAVAGTHGKTTTASMLAWILESAGEAPGFLIGGMPNNFAVSARLGEGHYFVVEADEYDSAFFDKRSKFIHYRPWVAILNNLEFDHADIFPDIQAIQRQFHHLVRTVPAQGQLIVNAADPRLAEVLAMGCWTPLQSVGVGGRWQASLLTPDASAFGVEVAGERVAEVRWHQRGDHNVANALAAMAAAAQVGVEPAQAAAALATFGGVKRRLELRGCVEGINVYDDFAHHPTAVAATLRGLRASSPRRLIAVLEPRSNTMRLGTLRAELAAALALADRILLYQPPALDWALEDLVQAPGVYGEVMASVEEIIAALVATAEPGDCIAIMSNGGFEAIHERLLAALQRRR